MCISALASSFADIQEGFGRFGYAKFPQIPGFQFSEQGFKVTHPSADVIKFVSPLKTVNRVAINRWRMVALTDGGPGKPSKLRFDLADFGFSMYFPSGIELKVSATNSPLLTWKEGSVKEGVPTPNCDWVGLSFQDRQPPVVLGFPEDKASLSVKGELGNWTIKSNPEFKGWVRFSLPFGTDALQTTTAHQLGLLSARLVERELLWFAPLEDLKEPTIEEDSLGLTATWKLPRQRTVVPLSFFFGQYGNYPLKVQSEYTVYPSRLNGDPVILSVGSELKVRFPVRRIPNGRGLSVGELLPLTIPTTMWEKPIDLVTLGLTNTLANRGREVGAAVKQLLNDYYESAKPQTEPNSKLATLYSPNGEGVLAAAVHSLLTQSTNVGEPESPADDPQFVSLAWRQDPYTGSLGMNNDDERRALAIGSLAGAFSASPELRINAALMEAGLSASYGKEIWLRRQGQLRPMPKFLEPLAAIRKGIFALTNEVRPDPVLSNWFSEVRVYSNSPVWLNRVGEGYELCWDGRRGVDEVIKFVAPYSLSAVSKRNVSSLFLFPKFGGLEIRSQSNQDTTSSATLLLPVFADALPLTALPPEYAEPRL